MLFDKITREHILKAVDVLNERGIPEGLSRSTFYDVMINNKAYPPKPIIAYANELATGKEPGNYFGGGMNTEAFNLLEEQGFTIVKKGGSSNSKLEARLKQFSEVADSWFQDQTWFVPRYNFFKSFYNPEFLKTATWEDFQKLGDNIHAFQSLAIARSNALGQMNLPIEEYRRIFLYLISRQDDVATTINNLYKKYQGEYFLPFFSDSSISELIGYAFPKRFVFYNKRDIEALEMLDISIPSVRGEKFGDRFKRYNDLIAPVIEAYTEIVGQRTETTIMLEVDQFFSWLYSTQKDTYAIKEMLSNYKNHVLRNGLAEEKYKWEFIRDYKGALTLQESLIDEVNGIKFINTIYHLSRATLRVMAEQQETETKKMFASLFDESQPLDKRVANFISTSKKIYAKTTGANTSQQDERSISNYLTLHDPSSYTFYKASYYSDYCDRVGYKKAKARSRYSHYLDLLQSLVENHISQDQELLQMVEDNIGTELMTQDPNYLLLAQDILYQMHDKADESNYWIFQGNPDMFDYENGLRNGLIEDWTITAHKSKIKPGDKVILWITGDQAGCYALATVTSEPFEKTNSASDDELWKVEDKNTLKVKIEISHNLIDNPIKLTEIQYDKSLSNLNIGLQGTNFKATKSEYESMKSKATKRQQPRVWLFSPGPKASEWDSFYNSGYAAIGWDYLGDLTLYSNQSEIESEIQSHEADESKKPNASLACYQFANEMRKGDLIIAKKGKKEFVGWGLVTSDYFFKSSTNKFKHRRKVDWMDKGTWVNYKEDTVVKTLTDITPYPDYVKRLKLLLGIDIVPQSVEEPQVKYGLPLNQILYGPPGTGKTFKLQKDYFPLFTSSEDSITSEQHFVSVVQDLSWWQVLGLALLEKNDSKVAELLQNRWVSAKANLSESKNVRATLWGTLQMHTIQESETVKYKQRQAPLIFNKNENKSWRVLSDEVKETAPELYELLDSVNNFKPKADKKIKRYEFVTFHQSYSYEEFVEGIKPVMAYEEDSAEDLRYEIKPGVFKSLCKRAANDPEHPYALFIDELNRGNVSQIFGELITLLEDDKRKGNRNELSLILPYSRQTFSVPNNLYIIGTMNTADRSVEALDSALRRRFEFQELMPDIDLVETEIGRVEGIDIAEVLRVLNERITALIDRDHQIGHSYFFKLKESVQPLVTLKKIFFNQVIPLLQEYFFNDELKMAMVLGEAFIKVEKKPKVSFAEVSGSISDEYERDYRYTLRDAKDVNMQEALNTLLGQEQEEDH